LLQKSERLQSISTQMIWKMSRNDWHCYISNCRQIPAIRFQFWKDFGNHYHGSFSVDLPRGTRNDSRKYSSWDPTVSTSRANLELSMHWRMEPNALRATYCRAPIFFDMLKISDSRISVVLTPHVRTFLDVILGLHKEANKCHGNPVLLLRLRRRYTILVH